MRFETTGARIRYARKERGMSVSELAKRAGIAPSTLYDLERGDSKGSARLHAIARILGYSADWLDNEKGPEKPAAINEEHARYGDNFAPPSAPVRMLPIVAFANAGNFQEVIDSFEPGDADNYYPAPPGVALSNSAYWTTVSGFSMKNPNGGQSFPPGTMILVEPEDKSPPNGSFVIARLPDTHEATFKRLNYEDGLFHLEPLNPQYKIITVDQPLEIIGTIHYATIPVSL